MSTITAKLVKSLRDRTGAGMMDCKKALLEVGGDEELAIDLLRTWGAAKAAKRAQRDASEGVVHVESSDAGFAMVTVSSETDFVALNEEFLDFSARLAKQVLTSDLSDGQVMSGEELLAQESFKAFGDELTDLRSKIGENIGISRVVRYEPAAGSSAAAYVHFGGKIGVLVELTGAEGQEDAARDVAMHVAAVNPAAVSADDIPAEDSERERQIHIAQAKEEGKPEAIIEKIVEGRMRKFYQQSVLGQQAFVKCGDSSDSRSANNQAEAGGGMADLKYPRALVKLSGESLAGERGFGIEPAVVKSLIEEIGAVHAAGVHLGLVVGGGNIVRGTVASQQGMDRVSADYMGMLATVINALALQDALEQSGVETRVMTAIRMEQLAEPYIRRRALRHIEKGRVVLFAGGTGNPYFTTDTAAVLRAIEMEADVILKATKVDGVYTADPDKDPDAKLLTDLTYRDILNNDLGVMDAAAISLCRENHLPVIVLNIRDKGSILSALRGERIGTLVT